jgi:1-acyl-sn-glycerol-3-phosphate acyltransferase
VHIDKSEMPDIKPPYLLLCNHNAFFDFQVMTAAIFPRRANYIVAIDGFLINEWLLRSVGCIGTRKFTNDALLLKHMLRVRDNGDVVVLFPEARYSLCGTSAILPKSLGKFAKHMKVPIVTLLMHGHHINNPIWNPKNRGIKHLSAQLKLLYTAEEAGKATSDEINQKLKDELTYDDFAWQKANKIKCWNLQRAKGLHKVLYQCPACNAQYKMRSEKSQIWCDECGKTWNMSVYGELEADDGITEFPHIPDWYEWERGNVRREVEDGTYAFSSDARVDILPNAKGFIDIGDAVLTHNMNGFSLRGKLNGEVYEEHWAPKHLYSCHVEYEYKHKGDCVDLNTNFDTLYIYPKGTDFSVTKIALATEELFKFATGDSREQGTESSEQ